MIKLVYFIFSVLYIVRMALIEAAEPAGNQRVHVQTWKLRAMIRAIRAAIAERDHGDMDPFGMSKLTELRAALQPFREGRTSMSAPRRDFAKCCGVQDHPLCKTCDRFLRPPDAVSQMWAIPRPFEHVEQDGSVRRGCRDYVEVRA